MPTISSPTRVLAVSSYTTTSQQYLNLGILRFVLYYHKLKSQIFKILPCKRRGEKAAGGRIMTLGHCSALQVATACSHQGRLSNWMGCAFRWQAANRACCSLFNVMSLHYKDRCIVPLNVPRLQYLLNHRDIRENTTLWDSPSLPLSCSPIACLHQETCLDQ